jgi:hypothetical protein
MQKVNHPLKARMFVGGLKSLLIDIVNDIEEIEKTGGVSSKFAENLVDVKAAIDLTLIEFKKVTVRCCEHGSEHDECDDSCSDDDDDCVDDEYDQGRVEEDVIYCAGCDEPEDECVCELEEEPPPPPPRKPMPVKKVESKVVTSASKRKVR